MRPRQDSPGPVVGTAGWSIPRSDAAAFAAEGTSLERYVQVFDGVEVNSSFHRAHRPSTWAKWAACVPERFRFAVKIPKTITHQAKLVDVDELAMQFAQEIEPLAEKLAILLVQLPPKLAFDGELATRFFTDFGQLIDADIVCEPRNATWFTGEADALLEHLQVARVAADPALCGAAAVPGGWRGLAYWRLHGSPAIYRSPYSDEAIDGYTQQIQAATRAGSAAWCVFDNTAASAATGDALTLRSKLAAQAKDD